MRVFVTNKTRFRIQPQLLKKAFKSTLKITKKKIHRSLSLVIVKDKEIKKINKLYRGKNEVTDVLAFSFLEVKNLFQKEEDIIGEIFISAERAQKQAKKVGHSLNKEVTLLFIHGLLHILGYEHKKKKEALKMRKLEQQILSKVTN